MPVVGSTAYNTAGQVTSLVRSLLNDAAGNLSPTRFSFPTLIRLGAPLTAVAGGGSAGPALQASSGSGTATGQQGGSGFGTEQTLLTNATTV
jgi:hypothetical protein